MKILYMKAVDTLGKSSGVFTNVTSFLFFCISSPSGNGIYSKRNETVTRETNIF